MGNWCVVQAYQDRIKILPAKLGYRNMTRASAMRTAKWLTGFNPKSRTLRVFIECPCDEHGYPNVEYAIKRRNQVYEYLGVAC